MTSRPDSAVALRLIESVHKRLVFGRRVKVLSTALAEFLPAAGSALDVGCGDGTLGFLLGQKKPTLSLLGLEIMPRPFCRIECRAFDGKTIPHPDCSFDVCLFVDVLHHTDDLLGLLREAERVTRRYVLIKDHLCENRADRAILSFMDWFGNRPHGVVLPFNYQTKAQWLKIFPACGLRCVAWKQLLQGLYPWPFSLVFGRNLHFIGLFEKRHENR